MIIIYLLVGGGIVAAVLFVFASMLYSIRSRDEDMRYRKDGNK